MTIEQRRALALAAARARANEGPPVTVDAAKSAGVGVGEAVIGMLGLPADVAELGARGLDIATRFVGNKLGVDVPERRPQEPSLGSGAIRRGVESVTGDFYKPQTTAGEFAKTIGEFSAGALLPGGALRRVANVLVPGVTSEAAGQATEGTAAEPYARAAGALAGGVAAARGITPAPATASRARQAAVLEAEGIPLTAGQRTGNMPLQWFEAAAADTPLAAGKAAQINDAQQRAFTAAVLKRMGAKSDIADDVALKQAQDALGGKFKALSARNTMQADTQLIDDLVRVLDDHGPLMAPEKRTLVESAIRDVGGRLKKNGDVIPGDEYQALRSRLGRVSRNSRQNDPEFAQAIKGVRNALDDNMARSISPTDKAAWEEARAQWRNWKAIQSAATGAGSKAAEGFISPSQLRSAVAQQDRSAYATGRGDLAKLARAGEAVLRPLPQSGTAPRAAAANTFASLAGMVGGGVAGGAPGAIVGAAAPWAIGRAMLSKPVQSFLGNQAAPMTPEQLRNLLLLSQVPVLPRPTQ